MGSAHFVKPRPLRGSVGVRGVRSRGRRVWTDSPLCWFTGSCPRSRSHFSIILGIIPPLVHALVLWIIPPVHTLVLSSLGDCLHARASLECRRRYTDRTPWEDVVSSESGLSICTSCVSNRLVSFHFTFFILFLAIFYFFGLLMFVFVAVSFNRNSGFHDAR